MSERPPVPSDASENASASAEEGTQVTAFMIDGTEFALMSYPLGCSAWREKLSTAELQVAEQVVLGRSNAEIADVRGTSVNTVTNQISTIFTKLGVSSRAELVALFVR
jgi:DNA-binding NarL/FixJ family response regulator